MDNAQWLAMLTILLFVCVFGAMLWGFFEFKAAPKEIRTALEPFLG